MPSINDDIGTKVNNKMFLLNVKYLRLQREKIEWKSFHKQKRKRIWGKMEQRRHGLKESRCSILQTLHGVASCPPSPSTHTWLSPHRGTVFTFFFFFSGGALFFSSLVPYYCNIMIWSCLAGSSSQLSESWSRAVIFIKFFILQEFLQLLQYQHSS